MNRKLLAELNIKAETLTNAEERPHKAEGVIKEVEHFPGGGGRIIHFNRRRNHQPKCFYCDTPSTHNCDFQEGNRTCSRHLCIKHRNFIAVGVDMCPPHYEIHKQRVRDDRAASSDQPKDNGR